MRDRRRRGIGGVSASQEERNEEVEENARRCHQVDVP